MAGIGGVSPHTNEKQVANGISAHEKARPPSVEQRRTDAARAAQTGANDGGHNRTSGRLRLMSVGSSMSELGKYDKNFSADLNGTDAVMAHNETELGEYMDQLKSQAAETLGITEDHPFIKGMGRTNSTYARDAMNEWSVSPVSSGNSSYYRDAPNIELRERREHLGLEAIKTEIPGNWSSPGVGVGSIHKEHGKLYYACALNSKPSDLKIKIAMGEFLNAHNLTAQVVTQDIKGEEIHSIAIFGAKDTGVNNQDWLEAPTELFGCKLPDALQHIVSMAGLPIDVDRLERVTYTEQAPFKVDIDLSVRLEGFNRNVDRVSDIAKKSLSKFENSSEPNNIQKGISRVLLMDLPKVNQDKFKESCKNMGLNPDKAVSFLESNLKNISSLFNKLQSSHDDSKANTLLNHVFMEIENYLVLTQPYTSEDFAAAFVANRQGYIDHKTETGANNFIQDAYLVSSGMDSIETALEAAASAEVYSNTVNKTLLGHDNIYFEARELTNQGGRSSESPIINACINSSTPGNKITSDGITSQVEEIVKNSKTAVSLVLDISLETTDHEVNDLLNQLHGRVESGDLQILLCKSYQKYPSLGSGKLLAGGITLINNGDAKFAETKTRLTQHQEQCNMTPNRHGQLTAHFTKVGRTAELAFIHRAAENASFLKDCILGIDVLDHTEGLPFLSIPSNKSANMSMVTMGYMNSFAGLGTSVLKIVDSKGNHCHRVNTGIESKAQLIENYYYSGAKGRADKHLETISKFRKDPENEDQKFKTRLMSMRPGPLGQSGNTREVNGDDWSGFIDDHAANIEASLLLGKMNDYRGFAGTRNPIYSKIKVGGMLNVFKQGVDLLNDPSASKITDFNRNKISQQILSGLEIVLTIDKATSNQKSEALELMIKVSQHCRNSAKANSLYHFDDTKANAVSDIGTKLKLLIDKLSNGLNAEVKQEIANHHNANNSIVGEILRE